MNACRKSSGVARKWHRLLRIAVAAHRACCASALAACAMLLASCASHPDRFYGLSAVPETARPPAAGYTTRVLLSVSIPSLVDRREMIVDAPGDRILVLEHERWAAPLSDLVTQTLARDIEQRRADVLVADRAFDQAGVKPVRIMVDIVSMSARRGGRATLDSHWRIEDPAARIDLLGGGSFSSPIEGDDYDAIARAFSLCLASLADRLVEKLPSQ
jgi:uncharacterized lipoprotein YmbA